MANSVNSFYDFTQNKGVIKKGLSCDLINNARYTSGPSCLGREEGKNDFSCFKLKKTPTCPERFGQDYI